MPNDLKRGLALAFVVSSAPTLAQTPTLWTPEAIVDLAVVSDAQISPDGQTVAFVRSGWCRDGARRCSAVWRVGVSGGPERRVTDGEADASQPRWSRDGSRIAFLSRAGGFSKLVVAESAGSPRTVDGTVLDFAWAPDGRRLACLVEEAGATALGILEAASLRWLTKPTSQPKQIRALAWSADGSSLIVAGPSDSAGVERVTVLGMTGSARTVAEVAGRVLAVAWSDDGSTLAWLARPIGDSRSEVSLAPARSGPPRQLSFANRESALDIHWKSDGRLAVSLQSGLQTSVDLWLATNVKQETVVPIGLLALGGASSWAASGEPFAVAASTAEHPAEVFIGLLPRPISQVSDTVGAPPPPIRRATQSNPQLSRLWHGAQEIVRYRSPRQAWVESLLLHPRLDTQKGRLPLMIGRVGGRPLLDGWNTDIRLPAQALAERGLLMLLTQPLETAPEAELASVLAGVDYLVGLGLADPRRVGLLCDNAALAVAGAASRRFASVAMVGVTGTPPPPILAFRLDPEAPRAEQIEGLRRLLVEMPSRLGS